MLRAIVHCRRRKIRCLLAHDDIQNRCSNCIRLKKECNFFPVDQQPSLERRPQSDSKADFRSGEASTSSSSSPRMVGGHVMEQIDHFVSFPTLPLDSHSFSHSVAPLSASLISPPSTIGWCSPSAMCSTSPIDQLLGSQGAQGFDFPHPDRPNWEHQYVDHGPLSAGHAVPEDHNRSYWKHVDSPMTPYSPFSSKAPNSAVHQLRDTGEGFAQFGGTRPDHGWMPQRSISYGHLEDLPHQYHLGYHQPQHTNARRRASEMRPPSLQTSNNSSSASVSEASNPPASAPLSNPSIHHYGPPQAWHGLPGNSPLSKSTEFGSWYSEPGPLAKVQEEEVDPRFGGHPAILYSNTGHH